MQNQQLTSAHDKTMPQHVAIIMDGNGRWAKEKGRLRVFGHRNGVQAVRRAVSYARKNHIQYLTLYAFSSENWKRPEKEVSALMALFMQALKKESNRLHKNNIKLKIIGDRSQFSESLQQKMAEVEQLTAENTALTLNIAANYGGRWDILQAAKKLAESHAKGEISGEDLNALDENAFQQLLVTAEQPPVDLVIRTSGEERISNFLLWQIAYAELFFTPILWPDFNESVFQQAIDTFQQRNRRFGG